MNNTVEQALVHWGLEGAPYTLIAARENAVFRVDGKHGSVALRLHRSGYRTDDELRSELLWMRAVSDGGMSVPAPIAAVSGDVLVHVSGIQVDVLTWLPGTTLDTAMATRTAPERATIFKALGQDMARLHDISDAWSQPKEFDRVAWDADGLLGDAPVWGRFWSNPHLSSEDRSLFESFRSVAAAELASLEGALDYGLIHADLVPANVMMNEERLNLIDFDDGGFGFRVFELATALHKYMGDADFPSLRAALIAGYTSIRTIDLTTLDLFLAVRVATYVGWNIARLEETDAVDRNARFIDAARVLAQNYLAARSVR